MENQKTEKLTETENKIYLVLSLIFEKVMDAEASYSVGLYQWQKMSPDILQSIGLNADVWTKLSDFGDQDETLQDRLAALREKYEQYSRDHILTHIAEILKSA